MSRVTLSHKCLAGVQENLASLHDHALNSKILPDVLRLAHFVVHDSKDEETGHHSSLICEACDLSAISFNQSIKTLLQTWSPGLKKNKQTQHSYNTNKSQKSNS